MLLGPTVNVRAVTVVGPGGRDARRGPVPGRRAVPPEVRGIESSHVVAEVKHYLGYDQETDRFGEPPGSAAVTTSSRHGRCTRLPAAVKAAVVDGGALGIMCRTTRSTGSTRARTRRRSVRFGTWGFAGIVGPDAVYSVRDPVAAFNAGADLFVLLPSPRSPPRRRPDRSPNSPSTARRGPG